MYLFFRNAFSKQKINKTDAPWFGHSIVFRILKFFLQFLEKIVRTIVDYGVINSIKSLLKENVFVL